MALRNARDVYTAARRACPSGSSPPLDVVASSPDEKDAFFDPAGVKPYRHPTFYDVAGGADAP
jgi:ring-1,2-phenylacetyl-CoA epoxidase subunit PaaB